MVFGLAVQVGLVAFCHVEAVMESCVLLRLCALRCVWARQLWWVLLRYREFRPGRFRQLWFGAACFVPFCYGSLGEVCQVVAS